MHILHTNKTEYMNNRKICVNIDHVTHGEEQIYGQLVSCQILERPTQRLQVSRSIETEAKKAHKPGERSPYCAVGDM